MPAQFVVNFYAERVGRLAARRVQNMLEVKELTLDEVRVLYENTMPESFPPSELRPFSSMRELHRRGLYDCRALLSDGELLGYAFFTRAENGTFLLLDYLAILPEKRGMGLGSSFLSLLRESLSGKAEAFLIEAENPESAKKPEDRAARERRIRFYRKNGCVLTDSRCLLFGVDYAILALPLRGALPGNDVLFNALNEIYRTMFPNRLFRAAVCRPERKPKSVEKREETI